MDVSEHTVKDNILNRIHKELSELKSAIEFPRLHISNYFTAIRTEIDLEIAKQFILVPNDSKETLNKNYSEFIGRLDTLETECLNRCSNTLQNDLAIQISVSLRTIETRIKSIIKRQHYDIYDFLYLAHEIDDLIYETQFQIEKSLLLNRTCVYLTKTSSLLDLFTSMSDSNSGKLIVITNSYFAKRGLSFITK